MCSNSLGSYEVNVQLAMPVKQDTAYLIQGVSVSERGVVYLFPLIYGICKDVLLHTDKNWFVRVFGNTIRIIKKPKGFLRVFWVNGGL